MPLFADSIYHYLQHRGEAVELWQPTAVFSRFPSRKLKKWLGYIDQYLIFPFSFKIRSFFLSGSKTIYIFTDQAQGIWISFLSTKKHVVHCHDFVALKSALGRPGFPKLSATGVFYQKIIKRGFSRANNFICVSNNTKKELLEFLRRQANVSVIENDLNRPYYRISKAEATPILNAIGVFEEDFFLHVGGNQWYKNREGVLRAYLQYCTIDPVSRPLVMIGAAPTAKMKELLSNSRFSERVRFVVRPPFEVLRAAYSCARCLFFPSITEGFGWPIIEALACGCPVLTTDEAPMNEVGGDVVRLVPHAADMSPEAWTDRAAELLMDLSEMEDHDWQEISKQGLSYIRDKYRESSLAKYLSFYQGILHQ
ncbi:glycosyltransferase [Pseudacidovorax intermedius]|uniref:glycosyltransferase n=1 Tax=Pseudacidovorax intermedius TaxID=433924 RepID=UPI0018CA342E|nr:glycosyltransferase [Pseudacidovorax intermedius]